MYLSPSSPSVLIRATESSRIRSAKRDSTEIQTCRRFSRMSTGSTILVTDPTPTPLSLTWLPTCSPLTVTRRMK